MKYFKKDRVFQRKDKGFHEIIQKRRKIIRKPNWTPQNRGKGERGEGAKGSEVQPALYGGHLVLTDDDFLIGRAWRRRKKASAQEGQNNAVVLTKGRYRKGETTALFFFAPSWRGMRLSLER